MHSCIVLNSFKDDIFMSAAFVHRVAAATNICGGLQCQSMKHSNTAVPFQSCFYCIKAKGLVDGQIITFKHSFKMQIKKMYGFLPPK